MEFGNFNEQPNKKDTIVGKGPAPEVLESVIEKTIDTEAFSQESEDGVKVTKEFFEDENNHIPDLDENFTPERVNDFLKKFGDKRDDSSN